ARLARIAEGALAACGLFEAVNYSFVSLKALSALRFTEGDRRARPVALRNPLSEDFAVMRTSLLPGLVANARHNEHALVRDVHLFEVGRVFWPRPSGASALA